MGWADYLLRFEDFGVRLICFALVCAACAVGFLRFVVAAWRYQCSDLQAAHRIERRFPVLRDRLSNAVAFVAEPTEDELAGSVQLRRAVITDVESVAEPLDFDDCINRRQTNYALMRAILALAVMLVLGWFQGGAVALAAKRMFVPWGDDHWPRRHVLQFVEPPTRLATGQDFEVALVDANGRLPDRVEIHYWFDGDAVSEIQTQQMQPLGNKLVHRLANVTRSFRYRATGGDDQAMPWIHLTLVEPPKITQQEVILHPPAYTGLEKRSADGDFRALIGTRVTFRVRTSKPLSVASLDTNTMGSDVSIPLLLDRDRCGFSMEAMTDGGWEIAHSGTYGFRLVDQQGLDIGIADRWEVDAVRDSPPTVSLKLPTADLQVTPRAAIPIEAIAKDDLALHEVSLHYKRSDSSGEKEEVVSLWQGPPQVTPEAARGVQGSEEGVHLTVQYLWDLTGLPSMKPGERIDFRLTAADYHGQVGESVWRRLTIISAEELEERIAQRQAEILAQIADIAKLQRETRSRVTELEIQTREAGVLVRKDLDQLQVAELNQRQVQQRLGHPGDGIAAQIADLISELKNNRADSPDLSARLTQFRDTVDRVNSTLLPPIQHELIDSLKIAREQSPTSQDASRPVDKQARDELIGLFQRVGGGQEQVVDTLATLLGQFAQWDNYQRLAREVGRLRREQEAVLGRTQQLRLETLTKDPNDLTGQQRATLKRLTERQNEITLRFNSLTSSMTTTQQQLLDDQPAAAATLADALDMARQSGIGGRMRDVGREMDQNRLGQATEQQGEVIELLEQLQDILANRRQYQLDRKVQQLRAAADRLADIRANHDAIHKQLADNPAAAADQLRQWGEEESKLAGEARQLAPRWIGCRRKRPPDPCRRRASNWTAPARQARQGTPGRCAPTPGRLNRVWRKRGVKSRRP